eukprot:7075930-Pyramimonas_sp.AAC.1
MEVVGMLRPPSLSPRPDTTAYCRPVPEPVCHGRLRISRGARRQLPRRRPPTPRCSGPPGPS